MLHGDVDELLVVAVLAGVGRLGRQVHDLRARVVFLVRVEFDRVVFFLVVVFLAAFFFGAAASIASAASASARRSLRLTTLRAMNGL